MLKTIRLAINAFPTIPPTLREDADPQKVAGEIPVNLGDLYHHYYLDSWGLEPPDPDPAHFEQIRYLMPCRDFRFRRHGLGGNKTFKGNKSHELGQAFCRWFLAEHLGIVFFAQLDEVRDHGALAAHGGVSVVTNVTSSGDAPDYFCTDGNRDVFLAEAKGTSRAVGFAAQQFQVWRNQFKRVTVLNHAGTPMWVKGFIVATRWASDLDGPRVFTKLSAEDPVTDGDQRLLDESGSLAAAIRSVHYAATLAKLQQPLLSAALRSGFQISDDLQFRFVVWESLLPSLKGLHFVGGYYPANPRGVLPIILEGERLIAIPADPLRLDISAGTFFGIELSIFKQLVLTARAGSVSINELRPLAVYPTGYSGVSLLADGHVLGTIELFRPINQLTL
jgi:hypothetical protein